jgi:N-acetylmuramoyl-L-alanine amidase
LYTRTTDVYDRPQEKAEIANRSGADLFVSIHRNAMPVPGTGSGASVLVYEDSGTAAVLAENILKNLVELGLKDQGIEERPGLVVLRKTQMPAVLAEVGFIDNPSDNAFFDRNFDAIARAIADGILTTLREQKEQTPLYYQVQTGAFRDRGRAMRLAGELQSAGFPAFIGIIQSPCGSIFRYGKRDPHGTECKKSRLSGISGAGGCDLLRKEFLPLDITR